MIDINKFDVDSSVVESFIFSQNGTLATGLRELIINGIDKGSESIEVKITNNNFEVIDHGHGFDSASNIKKYFGCFGTPHAEGDAKFGVFRIGRGQIMKFGAISWHSNEFSIHTDVKNLGMGYKLDTNDHMTKGCIVKGELYQELTDFQLASCIKTLESLVCYLSNDVVINKKLSSARANNKEWDYEDDKIKITWNNSGHGVRIYSQGAYVKTINSYHAGSLNGDIISKDNLILNMARNEISEDDPIWIHISKIITEKAREVAKKKMRARKMDDFSRGIIIRALCSREYTLKEVSKYLLIKDFKNKSISILNFASQNIPLTLMEKGYECYGEAICMQKIAFVVDKDELSIWGVNTLDEFIKLLAKICKNSHYTNKSKNILSRKTISIEQLSRGMDSSIKILKPTELTSRQAAARKAIIKGSKVAFREMNKISDKPIQERKVLIGESIRSMSWTDGITYNAFNVDTLCYLESGIEGAVEIASIICNEYSHNSSNIDVLSHDLPFYEDFYSNIISNKQMILGKIANSIYKAYARTLLDKNESIPKKFVNELPTAIQMDSHDFYGEVLSGGKVSALLTIILDYYSANYKFTKSNFKFSLSLSSIYPKTTYANNLFEHLFKIASMALGTKLSDLGLPTSHDEVHKVKRKLILEWGEKNNHDLNCLIEICKSKLVITVERIAYIISLDKTLNIRNFERQNFEYKNTTINRFGIFNAFGLHGFDQSKIADDSKGKEVEGKVLYEMMKVLKMIKCPEIKKDIENSLLSEDARLKLHRFT